MPQAFRNTFLTLRDLIVSAGPLAFLAVGRLRVVRLAFILSSPRGAAPSMP